MEFYEEHSNVSGKFPECGAIFMSNRTTRKECFERKLLGLPSGLADFVKQVKAGMILFLFEFERRELHGVFEACSDGAMNIEPHAYSSAGKQFPAQVKFIQIWRCDPLSENEFRDAIRENYFSKYKFNFGLSKRQVRKLLLLFSERKIEDRMHERLSTRRKVARTVGCSLKEVRSAAEDRSFATIDGEKDEWNADASFDFTMSTDYFMDSISKHGRGSDDFSFAPGYGLGDELKEDHGFQPPSIRRPDLLQSNPPLHFSEPGSEENSLISDHSQQSSGAHLFKSNNDQFRQSSTEHLSMELHNSQLSISPLNGDVLPRSRGFYPAYYGDGVAKHDIPYDPDVPNRHSSFPGVSNSGSECPAPHSSVFHSLDQAFPPHVDPEGTCRYLNTDSSLPDYIPLPYPEHHEYLNRSGIVFLDPEQARTSHGNRSPLLDNRCSPSNVFNNSVLECHPQNSIPPSYANQSFSPHNQPKGATKCRNIQSCLSFDCPLSYPSHHDHSTRAGALFADDAFPENMSRNLSGKEKTRDDASSHYFSVDWSLYASEGMYSVPGRQMTQDENNEAFAACIPRLERASTGLEDCHEKGFINPDTHQNYDRMYSDQKKRKSVFSRIALPAGARKQDEYEIDSSVDEIMAMLDQNQWVNERNFKQQMKRHNKVTKLKNNEQIPSTSKLLMSHLTEASEEMVVHDISAGNEDGLQAAKVIPFVDFKRRRKVQKIQSDANNEDMSRSAENIGSSGQKHKRIKLIRPKFSIDEPSSASTTKISDNGSRTNNGQSCSNFEAEGVETCVLSSTNSKEERKAPLQHDVTNNVLIECRSNVEKSLSCADSKVDRLLVNHGYSNYSLLKDSSLESCEVKPENKNAWQGLDPEGGNETFSQNVEAENSSCRESRSENLSKKVTVENRSCPLSAESAIERMKTSSMDHNLRSEKVSKEFGNDEEPKQQCEASMETVNHSNMQESGDV